MITSMRLQRFKNFRDATLQLGPLTVIVGTNASGKSNLRDAFRFIHGMARGYSLAEIIGEKYVEGGVLQWKGIRGGTRELATHGESSFSLETFTDFPQRADQNHSNVQQRFPGLPDDTSHLIDMSVAAPGAPPYVIAERFATTSGLIYGSHPSAGTSDQQESEFLFVQLPRDEISRKHGKLLRFSSSQSVLSQFPKHKEVRAIYRKPAEDFLEQLKSM